jgi:hypothetical protein
MSGVLRRLLSPLVGVPISLPAALLDRFPELGDARWRRGGLPPRVGGWCLLQPTVAAITLWRTVYLAPDVELDPRLLLHELRHVQQFQGSLWFPVDYILESLRRGYGRNKYEIAANSYAAHRLRGEPPARSPRGSGATPPLEDV